jgi:Tol biopolymer transport system component
MRSRIQRVCHRAVLCIALLTITSPLGFIRAGVRQHREEQAERQRPLADSDNAGLPLVTTRTIRFTTDEGTWISLDVSPDGKTIVFDLVGDLYTLPIAGGRATRITEGPSFDAQPRYSPDGKTIAFTSDRSGTDNLWLINSDGQNPRALTQNEHSLFISPAWTPDGNAVIVSKTSTDQGVYDLYLYHLLGGAGRKLTSGEFLDRYVGATFGKDARYVYASVGRHGHGMAPGRYQIVAYNLETGQMSRKTNARGGAVRPVLSPDGRYLVYATRLATETALKLRDLGTGDERLFAPSVQYDMQHLGRLSRDLMPGAAFTPDSSALVIAHHGKIWRIEVPSGKASVIPFTAEIEQRLGPLARFNYSLGDPTLTVRQIRSARPSPDGKRLAFTALDRLWVMDLPDGAPRRLTAANIGEHSPVWSPDGRYIAYVTWDDIEGGDIYRVKVEGAHAAERLTRSSAFYHKLNYTPDGTRLFAVREPRRLRIETLRDAYVLESDESELISLSATGGPDTKVGSIAIGGKDGDPLWFYGTPHFATDSDRLYIRDNKDGLVSMRFDGSDRRSVLKVTQWEYFRTAQEPADDIVLSPTGNHAIALLNDQLYLITLPSNSPPGQTISISNLLNSPVPIRQVTHVGADFIGWRPDGRGFYYSLGRSFFTYDLAQAESLIRRESATVSDVFDRADTLATTRVDVTITLPRDRGEGVVALRGARIITMRGDDIIERGVVIVRNDRIEAVGRLDQIRIPAGARVIDVTGKTILPGLLDIHDHINPRRHIHRTQVWEYLATLAYGVTTSRDPQTGTSDILTYADLVETGMLLGPRRLSTGPGIMPKLGITSLEEARNVLRRYSEFYSTQTIKQYLIGSRRLRQWHIIAARELGLTSTAESGGDFRMNLTLVLDGYPAIEHEFEMFPMYRDVVELLARSGTIDTVTFIGNPHVSAEHYYYTHEDVYGNEKLQHFTPDELLTRNALRRSSWYHESQFEYRQIAAQCAKILAAGGRLGSGAHGNLNGLGTHWNLWALASGGMPLIEVLRSATIYNAEAIGLAKELGSLEPGKAADLIVLNKNPLEDIRHTTTVLYVMKSGRLYEAQTLTEIWPRDRSLDPGWWNRTRLR